MGREEQIINERIKKLKELKSQGVNPYPNKFEKKETILEILNSKLGKDVKTAGRLMTKRDLGKIIFCNFKDGTGEIQIILQQGETPEKTKEFFKKYIDAGDFVGIIGKIIKTKTGQKSILVKNLELLTKSILPLPEKFHGLQDKEEKYRKRYLHLIMNPEVQEIFKTREKIIETLRNFLKIQQFIEVETPVLQTIYGGASATPFTTHLNALNLNLYLSISPELYLKRLIVGGMERVYTICKNFRNEGIDSFHNPEFTMMEYYAAYQNYEDHIKFTEDFFKLLKKNLGLKDTIEYQGKKISLKIPFKKITFKELILKHTQIDIDKENTFEKLSNAIKKKKLKNVQIKECSHYGALLDEMYKRVARPNIIQPTFLTHYPVEMIALAKRNEKDSKKINSIQLIINGAEIIKAYDELNDPYDQEKRLKEQEALLRKGDGEAMPMDEDFINALKIGMPPTAGYGMGIDRLTMFLTNQKSIRDVILYPFMKPEEKKQK